MADLRERVTTLLKLRGLSQAEAGRRSGFKNAAFINDIVRGHKIDVGSKGLGALAIGLETSEDYLLGKIEDPEPRPRRPLIKSYDPDIPDPIGLGMDVAAATSAKDFPFDAIKELKAPGGMGGGGVVQTVYVRDGIEVVQQDELKDDYWRFPTSVLTAIGATPMTMLAIECQGDSMQPTLSPGERVWVNTLHKRPSPDGLYAVRDDLGEVVIKRLHLVGGSPPRLSVISDNPLHPPRQVDMEELTIIGKVVAGLRLF